jgi:hypothetical protein
MKITIIKKTNHGEKVSDKLCPWIMDAPEAAKSA